MTEEDMRVAQLWFLQQEHKRMWTPSVVDVARLVIERINDKTTANAKPSIDAAVAEVLEVLGKCNRQLADPELWKIPAPPPP